MCPFTGELPLEIIRMVATGIIPNRGLSGNKGFTLPANIGELGDDITELNLSYCSLKGARMTLLLHPIFLVLIIAIFALGCLPTALGDNVNLTVFNVAYNKIQGQLGSCTEWLVVFC